VFSGTEETLRRFKLRWDQYMHHYVPLESNAHQWRGAKGWFADYTRAEPPRKSHSKKGSKRGGTGADDADFERFDRAPLIEAQIAANGETGAWTCACPSEEYVLNRMFNDELFPAERDADRIPETPTRWGGDDAGNLASAELEGGYSLVPGLGLLPANARKREEPRDENDKSSRDGGLKRAPSVKGSEGSEKGFSLSDAEAFVDGADRESYEASLVGPRVTPEGQPRLPKRASLGAATVNHNPARAWDMDPRDAASLVDAAARAAVGSDAVAVEYELAKAAPAPRRRAKLVLPPPEKYAGFMVDASEDKRGHCARDARNPAGYAELPSMGLKKWRF
jgi:hypothetical protein